MRLKTKDAKTHLFLVLILFSWNVQSKELYGSYKAEVVKVIDGDTVKLNVRIWPQLTQQTNLRLKKINTPEKRGKKISDCEKKAGQATTNFRQKCLKGAKTVIVSDIQLGKFSGRVLGKLSRNGKDLGEALIKAGHAKPYSGGKRKP